MLAFADNFQAGAVLTLVLPIALLIAIVVWYLTIFNRIPKDTLESATTLPTPEVVAAAGDAVDEITPMDPQPPQAPPPGSPS